MYDIKPLQDRTAKPVVPIPMKFKDNYFNMEYYIKKMEALYKRCFG